MPLIFSLSNLLLSYKRLTIFYSYPLITTYKLVSAMLISPLVLDVVAANVSIIVGAFSSMLFDLFTVTIVVIV